jgi:hypothetical protein
MGPQLAEGAWVPGSSPGTNDQGKLSYLIESEH